MKSRLLFGLMLAAPTMAQAVGLGDIHLGSALNQPLNADIELLGATPEELTQLRAGVASREIFARYGIDRPAFVAGLVFKVTRDASGRNVLTVHSNEAINEPFVTFLVELSWPRGHLVREYTVLLDPPVFEHQPSAAPPMAAPVTGTTSAPAAGMVERAPAPRPPATAPRAPVSAAPSAPPPPRPAAPPAHTAGGGGGSSYTVVANDSLSLIVRREGGVSAPADVNRLMIATFRANPAAFYDNINRLRRGAVLRLPPQAEWSATDAQEAALEVRRQVDAWRAGSGGAGHGGSEARLRLVVPKETGGKAGEATAATAAPAGGAGTGATDAEARRLLELKNAELARLQGQTPPAATTPAAPAATAPSPAPEAAPAAPAAAPKKPAAPAEPSFLDSLSDNALYAGIAAVVVLVGGLIGVGAWRRRREAVEFDESLQPVELDNEQAVTTQSLSIAEAPHRPDEAGSAQPMVVEEPEEQVSREYVPPPFTSTGTVPASPAPAVPPVDGRLAAEWSIDQADPLAEADFHMAYGLYDQAADIVKAAIEREPGRRDLALKLLEVYFVWGNKDAFLDVARSLARTRDEAPGAEWDKVAIMGRQIAGDDPLFTGPSRATGSPDVDLNLDAGGTQGLDLELLGDASMTLNPTTAPARGGDVKLDLGKALAGSDATADTGEAPTLDPDRFDLLLEPEPAAHPATPGGERTDAQTVERPALSPSAFKDVPTMEMPAIRADDVKADASKASELTAEISVTDLGFEADSLDRSLAGSDHFGATDHPTLQPTDGATLIAGLDPRTRSLLADADAERTLEPAPRPVADEATKLMPSIDGSATALLPAVDSKHTGDTQEIELSGADLDIDLNEFARSLEPDTAASPHRDEMRFSTDVFATGVHKQPEAAVDLNLGAPLPEHREPTVNEHMPQDLNLPELEPVTLSEVGTKLDLARAYMDMGDPDGARSILQEVLSEGSASQKVEAQRLIETLPH